MARWFSKLFNIRADEWARVLLLYVMFLLIITSCNWGRTIVEAAFLEFVGVQFLPWIFVVNAVLSILAIGIYTAFADRVANDRLLIAILALSVACIAAGLVLLEWRWVALAYPLLYLIYNVVLVDVFNLHSATYMNGFYDTRAAKRVIPVVSSSGRVAGIVAGLTMPLLNSLLAPPGIITIWLGALGLAAAVVWLMPHLLNRNRAGEELASPDEPGARENEPSYVENIREGYRYVAQSPFLLWLALSTFLSMVLVMLLYYQASQIMVSELKTTENISNFVGVLTGITNLIILPFQMFLLSRIIDRIGLGNTSLIFPFISSAIGGAIIAIPSLPAAALAYIDKTTLRTTLNSVTILLFNAVPVRVKGRARAFIGGLVTPIGSLVGGLTLLAVPLIPLPWFLPGVIGLSVVGFLVSAEVTRRQYGRALIAMLGQEDLTFLWSQEASDLTVSDPAMLTQLSKKLQDSATPQMTVFMAQLISQVGGSRAIPIVVKAARTAEDAQTRSALVDVIMASEWRDSAVRELYTDLLSDPDARVRQSAIAGLEQGAGRGDEAFLEKMQKLAEDPDVDVRVRALSALGRVTNLYDRPAAIQALNMVLIDEDPRTRASGVRVLAQLHRPQALELLVMYLTDPVDQVRLEAVVGMEEWIRAGRKDGKPDQVLTAEMRGLVVTKMRALLHDPIERVRQAAVIVVARLGTRECHESLIDALTDPSIQVRATIVDTLAGLGKAAIPLVHPRLEAADPQMRKMAAVVLSRVDRKEFGSLVIGSNVTANLLNIYRNYGYLQALATCNGFPSLAVLHSMLREQNDQSVDEIFYLVGALHDAADLKLIRESLQSDNAHTRANAVEALEALMTPQIARLIAPLFEPDLALTQLLALSQETWEMAHPTTPEALRLLATDSGNPWMRTVAISVLGEAGAPLAAQRKASEPKPAIDAGDAKPTGRARRVRSADLLGALMDKESSSPPAETKPQAPAPNVSSPPPALGIGLSEIEALLDAALADPDDDVRQAALVARGMIAAGVADLGRRTIASQGIGATKQEGPLLSTLEKIIFLKEVPFFQGMTIEQLRGLAKVCEEKSYQAESRVYNQGDAAGILYVVVNGRVGIEQEKRKGAFARVATVEAHSYFGEMSLFDNSPHSTSAIALQDTLTLQIRRQPLIALIRQQPELSLELIKVMNSRLREANARVAELTRSRPRELHKLYDQFEQST